LSFYSTTPQVHLGNRTVPHPRGKVVGGSSALNFLIFNRASKTEYDAWAEIGNDGWDWDSLVPSFVSSSNYLGITQDEVFPNAQNASEATEQDHNFIGTEGTIHVSIREDLTFFVFQNGLLYQIASLLPSFADHDTL
jgi:choline dehydrogenase-like flavoprotein